jgi:CheY-like chemotaxis protein
MPDRSESDEQPANARLRILVAEDNPANQLIIEAMLSKLGHRVEIVGDGRQACEAARAGDYDLILMDVQMPTLDGLAATRAIRTFPGVAGRVPIVALTANTIDGQREVYREAGMVDYVAKPIDLSALAATIARVAGNSAAAQLPVAAWPAPPPLSLAARTDLTAVLAKVQRLARQSG